MFGDSYLVDFGGDSHDADFRSNDNIQSSRERKLLLVCHDSDFGRTISDCLLKRKPNSAKARDMNN